MSLVIRAKMIGDRLAVVICTQDFLRPDHIRACAFSVYEIGEDGVVGREFAGRTVSEREAVEAFDRYPAEEGGAA